MKQDEDPGQNSENDHLDGYGLGDGHAVGSHERRRPDVRALGIEGDLTDAVEGVTPGGGETDIASMGRQPLAAHPHARTTLGVHPPQGLPVHPVLRSREEVHIVVVGLHEGAGKRPVVAEIVFNEGSRRGEARRHVGQPLVAFLAVDAVRQALHVSHAISARRLLACDQALWLSEGGVGKCGQDEENGWEQEDPTGASSHSSSEEARVKRLAHDRRTLRGARDAVNSGVRLLPYSWTPLFPDGCDRRTRRGSCWQPAEVGREPAASSLRPDGVAPVVLVDDPGRKRLEIRDRGLQSLDLPT